MNKYLLGIKYGKIKLNGVPEEKRTEEICRLGVADSGKTLDYVPEHMRTKELCAIAVSQNGQAIKYVPFHRFLQEEKEEIYKLGVSQNGLILPYILQENGNTLRNVVKNPEELYRIAINQNPEAIWHVVLEDVEPNVLIELYKLAVKKDGMTIKYIPEVSRTMELFEIALRQNAHALAYVPRIGLSEEKMKEFYKIALEQDGEALEFIPVKERTEELCKLAISQNGMAIEHLPYDFPEESVGELCKIAVSQNGLALDTIKEYMTFLDYSDEEEVELCKLAVAQNGMALEDVSFFDISSKDLEEISKIAVTQNGMALEHVKPVRRTEELCENAVSQNGKALQYVPKRFRNSKMCRLAVEQDGLALAYVPEEEKTEELCELAVEKDYRALQFIPPKFRTGELCKEVVSKDFSMLRYVGREFQTLDVEGAAYKSKYPEITNEEFVELCKMYMPQVLLNSDRLDKIEEAIEEVIGDNPEEKKKLEKMISFIKVDKEYAPTLIDTFWDQFGMEDVGIRLDQTKFPNSINGFIQKVEKYAERLGEIPNMIVVDFWERPLEEYSKTENERLLKAGIIEKSENYREEQHKDWILKMYQIFGYQNALRLLDDIPEVSKQGLEWIAYSEVFEKKYILTEDIGLSVEIINQINSVCGNRAFEVFKELNKAIETGETSSIKALLAENGIDEHDAEKIERSIKGELDSKKLEKIEGPLRNNVNEIIDYQQGRIYDLIYKILKDEIVKGHEIFREELEDKVIEELHSRNETGEYIYSPVIRREEENIKNAVGKFINDGEIVKVLNDNMLKMLKRTKDKIGQGWIRKLLGISLEMNREEYEKATEKLGLMELEHEEEIRLKGKDEETKARAREMLVNINNPEIITFEKLEVMFGRIKPPYSREFGEYFIKHKYEFMNNVEYIENFAKMHNAFNRIINRPTIRPAYEQGRLELKTVLDETQNNYYHHKKGEAELAKRAREAQIEEIYWEDAREVFKITREREETTIPPTKVIGKRFRGRILRVDDPLQLFVGDITGCCQRFGDVGEGAMLHSALEKNGGVFVIEEIDEKSKPVKLVAQSWTWRNGDVMCFDNIEVKGDSLTYEEQEEVLRIYREAGEKAIKIDAEELEKMLKAGEITKEQYEYYALKQVRIGLGYNQGMPVINEKIVNGDLEKTYDVVKPKEADKVYTIGDREVTPWIDSESSIIIAKNDKLGRAKKPEKIKDQEVPITYRKPREIRELQGEEIDEDVVDIIREIEAEVYREKQQIVQDAESVEDIAWTYGCEAENLKVSISRDKDWYAMYYDKEDSIYIADIALVNGTNSEKNSNRSTESLISSIELAQKMYEVFIEASEKGKTVTCDATKDTSGLNIDTMIKNGLVEVIKDEECDWEHDNDIKMRNMTLVPNKEKLEKELEKIEKLLSRAESRRRVYDRKSTSGIGEEDR